MRWQKRGLIYHVDNLNRWQFSHSMLPTPLQIDSSTIRIYLGFCDTKMRGRIGFVDVFAANPSKIKFVSPDPILDIGLAGAFDDNGVVPVSVIRVKDKVYLYYIGFQVGVKVPYYMFCGLAISDDGGASFNRLKKTPILDRNGDELYARCGCNVVYLPSEKIFRMWYIGSVLEGWTTNFEGKKVPLYKMKTTFSNDGITWDENSFDCMDFINNNEHGFGRPSVFEHKCKLKMYYSIRNYTHGYDIGFAESNDGLNWQRKDNQSGINTSKAGWDSKNISYPCVITCEYGTYLFYNGNDYGKTGFGYAVLE